MSDATTLDVEGAEPLQVLEYLRRLVEGTLRPEHTCHLRYPTAISRTLGMRLVAVSEGSATVEIDANADVHGNQQGTVHGGLISELADAYGRVDPDVELPANGSHVRHDHRQRPFRGLGEAGLESRDAGLGSDKRRSGWRYGNH